MSRRSLPWCYLLILCAGCNGNSETNSTATKDYDRLNGKWQPIEASIGGVPANQSDVDELKIELRSGGKSGFIYVGRVEGTDFKMTGDLKLDHRAEPKAFDAVDLEGNILCRGIYEIDGDRLKLCYAPDAMGERPSAFAGNAANQYRFIVAKRK